MSKETNRANVGMEKSLHAKFSYGARALGLSLQSANEQAVRQWLDRHNARIRESAKKFATS